MTDREARERKRGRRSALPGLVAELDHVANREATHPVPSGVDVTIDGSDVRGEGPEGPARSSTIVGDVTVARDGDDARRDAAPTTRGSNRALHGLRAR